MTLLNFLHKQGILLATKTKGHDEPNTFTVSAKPLEMP